jgi:hypothetical protein
MEEVSVDIFLDINIIDQTKDNYYLDVLRAHSKNLKKYDDSPFVAALCDAIE